jgi:thiol-disulfide isomerase/thioredoxin
VKRTHLSLHAAILAVLLLLPLPAPSQESGGRESLRTGSRLPPLEFTDLGGRSHRREWAGGDAAATLFFFFDISSPEGLYGLTYLEGAYSKAGDFGLRVLAVESSGLSREETLGKLERYQAVYSELSFPLVLDAGGALRLALGVSGLPETFIAERHGVIIDHRKGFDESTEAALNERIVHLLKLPPDRLGGSREKNLWDEAPEEAAAEGPLLFPGDTAPPLVVTDLEGREHRFLWSSEDAEVTIFFFWNDPCQPCVEEMLFLNQLHRRTAAIGLPVRILAVEADGLDAAQTRTLLDKYAAFYPPPSYPVVLDSVFPLTRTFGRGRMPTTYIMDENGKVLAHADDFSGDRIREWKHLIENKLPRSRGSLQYLPE